ncbi:MAG: 50S ribosomal protein L28 [Acetomicrobium sp.]|jgi:large subunit ribosomal protein L28|uniref:50S ribosomal protein L28 n=1 Tax=Acetomicrobium TaxID=49894 RepID=UPI0016AEB968|nr:MULTISPECIES: 50S ribosomal protein L28 [Acetomicrobium]MDI9376646.1 50S ribosomal protein L28 [Synergistota bacterium]NLI43176.1 50S ribosomal protein L28 [Synergistaceae bacterium]MDR9770809.1 50S ribosomal protein L28 [Acetomicrobium sp.]HOB10451.1 50S ribosomal protein L28 [Acetomicrobium sp.]HOM97445.1 50S ribosomal protein L28 [Acetomicrobium sp.]
MARKCDFCGRGPITGNRVSHSNRRTRHRWLVNLQVVNVDLGGGVKKRMKACTRCLRSGLVKRAI